MNKSLFILSEVNIDVIRRLVTRVIYLLHPPVTALSRYSKDKLAVANARLAAIDMTYLRHYLSAKDELLRINGHYPAVDGEQVRSRRAPAFLLSG
jgi:hypothetical protein